jgi:hypothetical protein
VLHLAHVLDRAGVERLLHDRLLGARAAAESPLQRGIRAHPRVDLSQSMSTGEDSDESVRELLDGSMLDGLLPDPDVLGDGFKELQ